MGGSLSMVVPRAPQFEIVMSSKFMNTRSAGTPSSSVTVAVSACAVFGLRSVSILPMLRICTNAQGCRTSTHNNASNSDEHTDTHT